MGVIEERFAPFLCVLSPNIDMTEDSTRDDCQVTFK